MILVKEEFVGGEKWRRAVKLGGSDAIVLWLALKNYCSQHPDTEGFVPDEVLEDLPGAPRRASKALQALIDCGRMLPGGSRSAGLIEPAPGGWQMHDYLDHSASPEELELRREKARLRQQSHRASKRRELAAVKRLTLDLEAETEGVTSLVTPGERDRPCDNQRDRPCDEQRDGQRDPDVTSPPGARPHGGAPARAPARAGAHPNPTQPNPDLRGLTSTILGRRRIEPSAELRKFAADHAIELDPFVAELLDDPCTAGLSARDAHARLAGRVMSAATSEGVA